jgi:uncharacterized protein (DUF302 family)
MYTAPRILSALGLLALSTLPWTPAGAEVLTHGHAYVAYLPPKVDMHDVLERLEVELGGQNWDVLEVQHLDVGMRKYGLAIEHKLVLACKSQYLAQALQEDPYVSLIIPCRFTLFREAPQEGKPGRVVLGFADPVHEAWAVDIEHHKAAEKAAAELKAVLENVAAFYGSD